MFVAQFRVSIRLVTNLSTPSSVRLTPRTHGTRAARCHGTWFNQEHDSDNPTNSRTRRVWQFPMGAKAMPRLGAQRSNAHLLGPGPVRTQVPFLRCYEAIPGRQQAMVSNIWRRVVGQLSGSVESGHIVAWFLMILLFGVVLYTFIDNSDPWVSSQYNGQPEHQDKF